MTRLLTWAVLALVTGCGDDADEPGSEEPGAELAPAEDSDVPEVALPWRWFREHPDAGLPSGLDAIGLVDRATVPIVGDPRTYVVSRRAGGFRVMRRDGDGAEVWRAELDADGARGPVILPDPHAQSSLYVAFASGGEVTLVRIGRERGIVDWRRELSASGTGGPISVQLGSDEGDPVVYAKRGELGRLWVVSAATGEPRGRRDFGVGLVELPWEARAPTPGVPINEGMWASADGGRYDTGRVRAPAAANASPRIAAALPPDGAIVTRLRKLDAREQLLWSTHEPHDAPFLSHVALREVGPSVVLAFWGASTSGARLVAHDRSSGVQSWTAAPYGIGPIGHSRYSNTVTLAGSRGRVYVRGDEGGGRYVAVFDASDGALLSNEVWRRGPHTE